MINPWTRFYTSNNQEWIWLTNTTSIIRNPAISNTFITNEFAELYHSNQSIHADVFFRFDPYPISKFSEYASDIYESLTLNLTLNSKFNISTWLFQMKKPINVIQRFHINQLQMKQVQQAWDDLFNGYMRNLEKKTKVWLPTAIIQLIKKNIQIGAAEFYCELFQDPRFGDFNP